MDVISALTITERDGAVSFAVRVVPRAKRTGIEGVHAGALKLRITAPPVDGAANDAVVHTLAAALDVARRDVRIVSGVTSRTKTVSIHGITAAAARARLATALA